MFSMSHLMITLAHLAKVYMHTYVTISVKIIKPFVVLAMLRIAHFIMNHTRFIIMAWLC